MYETELYEPVKKLFEDMGYRVMAEAADCDVAAEKDGEQIAIELKTAFNLKLVYQIVERQTVCRYVYAAIPKPKDTKSKKWKEALRLLKRLGAGLILTDRIDTEKYAQIVLEPQQTPVNINYKKRKKLKNEMENRTANLNTGGSSKKKIVTAYRENAIFIACCLLTKGNMTCGDIKKYGTGEKTYSILRQNYYGWFEKTQDGVYCVNDKGQEEVKEYKQICDIYINKIKQKDSENPSDN